MYIKKKKEKSSSINKNNFKTIRLYKLIVKCQQDFLMELWTLLTE